MEFKGMLEAWEEYKKTLQEGRGYMSHLALKQREIDFKNGYKEAYEKTS